MTRRRICALTVMVALAVGLGVGVAATFFASPAVAGPSCPPRC
jgi:hypothetical protein